MNLTNLDTIINISASFLVFILVSAGFYISRTTDKDALGKALILTGFVITTLLFYFMLK